jgi:hypothetical protein
MKQHPQLSAEPLELAAQDTTLLRQDIVVKVLAAMSWIFGVTEAGHLVRHVIIRTAILTGIAFFLAACQPYPGNSIPTGVAAPGHNWMEGGGG